MLAGLPSAEQGTAAAVGGVAVAAGDGRAALGGMVGRMSRTAFLRVSEEMQPLSGAFGDVVGDGC
jgi:hypothetical protein